MVLSPPSINDISSESNNNEKQMNIERNSKKLKKHLKKVQPEQNNNEIIMEMLKNIPNFNKMKTLKYQIILQFNMESIDWIPPLRLVPNRCNIQVPKTTTKSQEESTLLSCYYNNNIILEDAKHLWYETAANIQHKSFTNNGDNDLDHFHHESENDNNVDIDYDESWYRNWNSALILIKVWSNQRGLLHGHDTLTIEIIMFQLLYLFRTKQANPIRMTPIQIITAWLKLIAETDWLGDDYHLNFNSTTGSKKDEKKKSLRKVLVLPLPGMNEKQTIAISKLNQLYIEQTKMSPVSSNDPSTLLELYQKTNPECTGPILLDPSMTYNFMGRVSTYHMKFIQREAQKSLDCIHNTTTTTTNNNNQQFKKKTVIVDNYQCNDPFRFLFLTDARFWKRHDVYVQLNVLNQHMGTANSTSNSKSPDSFEKENNQETQFTNNNNLSSIDMGVYECVVRRLVHVLNLALTDRVYSICPLTTGNGPIPQQYNHISSASELNKESTFIDSNGIPTFSVATANSNPKSHTHNKSISPTGSSVITLGISLNSDNCYRLVDRGPPVDHVDDVQMFVNLWGSSKAEIRRFKDGAIVHAVVWDTPVVPTNDYVQFQNDDKWQGGIAERIIQHIIKVHFPPAATLPKHPASSLSNEQQHDQSDKCVQFALRNMSSIIDGVAVPNQKKNEQDMVKSFITNPLLGHRMAINAFEKLSNFLRKYSVPALTSSEGEKKSPLGIPLAIDAVEPLSPTLRYADLFPPIPHPMLGSSTVLGLTKVSGAIQSKPIEIQIRFGASSKWPTDLKAIGAAKTAMLISLVDGIEALKELGTSESDYFDGPSTVTSSYSDVGFMGFVFRIYVRADPEVKLLRSLRNPTPAAMSMLRALMRKTIYLAKHHTIVHAVYTKHPSSSATIRMARRWLASHLLSDHIPFEVLELLVAQVYTDQSSALDPPASATVGFLRFLNHLSSHDWQNEPLIVDPQGYFSYKQQNTIKSRFEQLRGSSNQNCPAMYIVSPCSISEKESADLANQMIPDKYDDEWWLPVFTMSQPEQVVLARTVALAGRSYEFLQNAQVGFEQNSWCSAFQESSSSFRSYSLLMKINADFQVDHHASSYASTLEVIKNADDLFESTFTRSMSCLFEGPKRLRPKIYRNLMSTDHNILLEWSPIQELVQTLRSKLDSMVLFFYNDLCPDAIAAVWRRPLLRPQNFSAINSAYVQPVVDDWNSETLVTLNIGDILRVIVHLTADIVVDIKIFDTGPDIKSVIERKRKNSPHSAVDEDSDSSTESLDNP